jgi:DNA-binding NtrC family response regulator
MVSIVVVGSDAALLEGIAQLLATAGHAVRLAATLADASAVVDADEELPLVALVERELLAARGAAAPALAPGGATVLYRTADGGAPSLPARVQRATLAEVTLPLERNRLLALVQHVVDRQQATGRPRRDPRSDRQRPPT